MQHRTLNHLIIGIVAVLFIPKLFICPIAIPVLDKCNVTALRLVLVQLIHYLKSSSIGKT